MDSTINGRTPEEIKKGLECCTPRYESKHWVSCNSECPFRNEGAYCRNALHACNKKYIQQLERERDAAVEDLKVYKFCTFCKHDKDNLDTNKSSPCFGCSSKSNWQWRGVQEVEM